MTQLTLGPKPHNNHYLFSDYYLDNRVQERREWRETDIRVGVQHAGRAVAGAQGGADQHEGSAD